MNRTLAAFVGLIVLWTGLLSSCDSGSSTNSGGRSGTVSAPTFSPAGGTYAASQSVTLTSATSGSIIYYTTDGRTPTAASSRYDGAITVDAKETIKAIAVDGEESSAVAIADYVIGHAASATAPWNSSIGYGSLTDSRDGRVYRTVKLGTQTWFAENLSYRNTTGRLDTVGECYDHDTANCAIYGRLYTSQETMYGQASSSSDVQGVCPTGWHVPSDAEWSILVDLAGGEDSAGTSLRSAGGWSDSGNGTDSHGFRVLPAGRDRGDGFLGNLGYYAYFGSASQDYTNSCLHWIFHGRALGVYHGGSSATNRFSLRCLKDN